MESKKINQLATAVSPSSSDLAIIGDPVTGVSKKITWLQVSTLIGTAANLQQVTDNGATTTNPVTIGGLTITGLSTGVLKSDSGVISSVPFGAANGVATLAGDGKVPSNQLPSYVDDVVEVANYAALPVTGETGKIYITLDNNKVYRWGGSVYVEVAANQAVWGSITGTLANQTDLQNALNLKATDSLVVHLAGTETITGTKTFSNASKNDGGILLQNGSSYSLSGYMNLGGMTDGLRFTSGGGISNYFALPSSVGYTYTFPAISGTIVSISGGNSTQYIDGTGSLQTFPTLLSSDNLVKLVRNQSGATMTAGTIVYISGATGNKPLITKAIATGDATSAQTFGLVQANIANNADGYVVIIGNIGDLDTSALTEGQQLYLSGTTAGAYTTTKPYAPIHLVYIGIVLRSHPTQGIIGVKIQNGYEMDELHNVDAYAPSNNDILSYNTTTSLWEHKQIATTLGFTPISLASLSATSPLSYNNGTGAFSIQVATASQNGYLSSTDFSTFNNKQAALGGTGFVKITGSTISYDNSTYYLASNPSGFITLASLSAGAGISYSNTTGVISSTITQYTDALARAAFSESVVGLDYSSSTGVLSTTTGYAIPTTAKQAEWDSAYSNRITSLTTLYSSGAATLVANTLNIPTYTLSGLGGQPLDADLTAIAALAGTSGFLKKTAADTWALDTNTYLTGNQTITLSGDISGSGATSITTTIGAGKVTNAMLAGSIDLTTKVTGLLPDANISSAATWNAKQAALNGTGFVKASGTTITYDNSTYVTTTTAQTISGSKTFSASPIIDGGFATAIPLRFKQYDSASFNSDGYTDLYVMNAYRFGFAFNQGSSNYKGFTFNVNGITLNTSREYTMPNAAGTLALTSDIPSLAGYVPYTGATQSVNLGANNFTAGGWIQTGTNTSAMGGGFSMAIGNGTNTYGGQANAISIYAPSNQQLFFVYGNGTSNKMIALVANPADANQAYFNWPAATSGTLALTSNIPTNNNQLTNGAGYITSYTETDTLASVTGRGATTSTALTISNNITILNGRMVVQSGGASTYGIYSGYDLNSNHLISIRANITRPSGTPTFTAGHQTCFVEYAEADDTTGWFFKTSFTTDYTEVARITRTGINWNGNVVLHAGNYTSYAVPTSRTITINGTSYDLSANRSWTITGTSQWTTSGSNIYYNSTGYVGIGVDPVVKFHVVSNGATYTDPAINNVAAIYVKNTNGAAGLAHSVISLRTEGANGGDPFIAWDLDGILGYAMGIDNSDSDKLKINYGWAALGSNTLLEFTTAGRATFGYDAIINSNLGVGVTTFLGGATERTIHLAAPANNYATFYLTNSTNTKKGIFALSDPTSKIFIGTQSDHDFGFVTNDTDKAKITSSGNFIIGTSLTDTGGKLQVVGVPPQYSGLVKIVNNQSGNGNGFPALQVINANGNHTYGVVAEFRVTNADTGDRPCIMFSRASGINWVIGMGATSGGSDNFRIGYRATYPLDAWATMRMDMDGSGNVTFAGDVTAFSDIRLKENIVVIDNALEKVQKIRGVKFTRKDEIDANKGRVHSGLIAQEVLEVLPEVVNKNEGSNYYNIAYGNMVGLLVEAIKEQQKQIDELKKQIA
jgi:hypothetical protein